MVPVGSTGDMSVQPPADADLHRRLVYGDESAPAEVYAAYGGLVRRVATRVTRSPGAAEDVAQEAFAGDGLIGLPVQGAIDVGEPALVGRSLDLEPAPPGHDGFGRQRGDLARSFASSMWTTPR